MSLGKLARAASMGRLRTRGGSWHLAARVGGTFTDLTALGIEVYGVSGVALPPMHIVAPGRSYQRTVVQPRRVVLRVVSAESIPELLATVLPLLLPDRSAAPESAVLRYVGAAVTLDLLVVLDAQDDADDVDRGALALIAHDAYWYATATTTLPLTVRGALASSAYVLERSASGVWSSLALTLSGVSDMYLIRLVYAGGATLWAAGTYVTGAVYTAFAFVRSGSSWVNRTSGLGGAYVYALAAAPDGTIYAGGHVTEYSTGWVKQWNGSAWSSVGTAPSACNALIVAPDGTLYGGFSSGVYRWTGAAWSELGNLSDCGCLALGPDATLYASASSGNGVWRWSGSAWVQVGGSELVAAGNVYALAVGLDGTIYAGGEPTLNGVNGYIVGIASSRWAALGAGVGDIVNGLFVDADGALWATGDFGTAGGLPLSDSIARWSGSAWYGVDVNLPAGGAPQPVAFASDGRAALGFRTAGTTYVSGVTTVTNGGSAAVRPTFELVGPGRVWQIQNLSTGAAMYLNLLLQTGEVVTIDCAAATISSSYRGRLAGVVQGGSTLSSFVLLPGANEIALFLDDGAASASVSFVARYVSLDSADG